MCRPLGKGTVSDEQKWKGKDAHEAVPSRVWTGLVRGRPRETLATVGAPATCAARRAVPPLALYNKTRQVTSRRSGMTYLGNGRFPRSLSSATYPASVVRHRPMSAGRLNAAILRRGASLSRYATVSTSCGYSRKDRGSTFRRVRANEEEQVEAPIRKPFSRDRQERHCTSDFPTFSLAA